MNRKIFVLLFILKNFLLSLAVLSLSLLFVIQIPLVQREIVNFAISFIDKERLVVSYGDVKLDHFHKLNISNLLLQDKSRNNILSSNNVCVDLNPLKILFNRNILLSNVRIVNVNINARKSNGVWNFSSIFGSNKKSFFSVFSLTLSNTYVSDCKLFVVDDESKQNFVIKDIKFQVNDADFSSYGAKVDLSSIAFVHKTLVCNNCKLNFSVINDCFNVHDIKFVSNYGTLEGNGNVRNIGKILDEGYDKKSHFNIKKMEIFGNTNVNPLMYNINLSGSISYVSNVFTLNDMLCTDGDNSIRLNAQFNNILDVQNLEYKVDVSEANFDILKYVRGYERYVNRLYISNAKSEIVGNTKECNIAVASSLNNGSFNQKYSIIFGNSLWDISSIECKTLTDGVSICNNKLELADISVSSYFKWSRESNCVKCSVICDHMTCGNKKVDNIKMEGVLSRGDSKILVTVDDKDVSGKMNIYFVNDKDSYVCRLSGLTNAQGIKCFGVDTSFSLSVLGNVKANKKGLFFNLKFVNPNVFYRSQINDQEIKICGEFCNKILTFDLKSSIADIDIKNLKIGCLLKDYKRCCSSIKNSIYDSYKKDLCIENNEFDFKIDIKNRKVLEIVFGGYTPFDKLKILGGVTYDKINGKLLVPMSISIPGNLKIWKICCNNVNFNTSFVLDNSSQSRDLWSLGFDGSLYSVVKNEKYCFCGLLKLGDNRVSVKYSFNDSKLKISDVTLEGTINNGITFTEFMCNGEKINKAGIVKIKSNVVDCQNIIFNNNGYTLSIKGKYSPNKEDKININFDDVLIQKMLPFLNFLNIRGCTNGSINVCSEDIDISLSLYDMCFFEKKMNNVRVNSNINFETMNCLFFNIFQGKTLDEEYMSLSGNLNLRTGILSKTDVKFSNYDVCNFDVFTSNVFTKFVGHLNGFFRLEGFFLEPKITGNVSFCDGEIELKTLKTLFKVEKPITIYGDNNGICFRDVKTNDGSGVGSFYGKVIFQKYKNPDLLLGGSFKNYKVLNTLNEHNDDWYGTVIADGMVKIQGGFGGLNINSSMSVISGSEFFIDIRTDDIHIDDSIHFVDISNKIEHKESKNIVLDLNILIPCRIPINVKMSNGNNFYFNGTGEVSMVNDEKNKENLLVNGNIEIIDGFYYLKLYEILQKKFSIIPGGSIDWKYCSPNKGTIYVVAENVINKENGKYALDNKTLQVLLSGKLDHLSIAYNVGEVNSKSQDDVFIDDDYNVFLKYLLFGGDNSESGSFFLNNVLERVIDVLNYKVNERYPNFTLFFDKYSFDKEESIKYKVKYNVLKDKIFVQGNVSDFSVNALDFIFKKGNKIDVVFKKNINQEEITSDNYAWKFGCRLEL